MKKVILDTSFLIDYTRKKEKTLIELLRLQKKKKVELIVPALVIFEFYSGLFLEKKEIFNKAELLFSKFKIVEVNEKIAKLAAEINRKNKLYQKIGAIDLLIGATALYFSADLATKNKKHFNLIPGLKFTHKRY